eukprot:7535271-Heterocapsa_arctica.AAC.1
MNEAETGDEAGESHEPGSVDVASRRVEASGALPCAPEADDARDHLVPCELGGVVIGHEAAQGRAEGEVRDVEALHVGARAGDEPVVGAASVREPMRLHEQPLRQRNGKRRGRVQPRGAAIYCEH